MKLIRKKRDVIYGFTCLFVYIVISGLCDYLYIENILSTTILIILSILQAVIVYETITSMSSHDIDTWKHSNKIQTWLIIGSWFGYIVGIIVYYILKHKEKNHLIELDN